MKRSLQEQLLDATNRREMYLDLARQCDREIINIEHNIRLKRDQRAVKKCDRAIKNAR